jgi:hypothetical protein
VRGTQEKQLRFEVRLHRQLTTHAICSLTYDLA